jgi:hypothetical protein
MDEVIINHQIKRRRIEEREDNQVSINFLILLVPLEIFLLIINNDLGIFNTLVRLTKHLLNLFNSTRFNSTVLNIWKENFSDEFKQHVKESVVKDLMDMPVDIFTPINKMLLSTSSQSQFSQFESPDYQQAVIAGGYILKHISKKEFKGTDIDILFSCDVRYDSTDFGNHVINGYIERVLDTCFDRNNTDSPYFLTSFETTFYYGDLKYVKMIQHFNIKSIVEDIKEDENIKIKIIFLKLPYGMTLIDYMNEQFDFSFCKCWFDGKSIGTDNLFDQIRRVGRINNKKTHLNQYQQVNREERVEKYKERGFKFLD